jgi:hypothetical protein
MAQGEHIIKRVIPLSDLHRALKGTYKSDAPTINLEALLQNVEWMRQYRLTVIEYASKGFAIDALVASVAEGWRLREKYGSKM